MRRALWILAVLLSHWRRHPMQLATLLIGLISATALWSGVQALNQQARIAYDRAAATFGGSRTAMLVSRDSATFPQQLFVELRRAGWPVSPMLEGRVQIDGRSFRLLGEFEAGWVASLFASAATGAAVSVVSGGVGTLVVVAIVAPIAPAVRNYEEGRQPHR